MRNLFQELKLRIDRENAKRTINDAIKPTCHFILKGMRPDGEIESAFAARILTVGEDFIEIEGQGMVDRNCVVQAQPINF